MRMAIPGLSDARSRWTTTTVFVLLFLLAFQSVWLIGTTTLRDHERLQKELVHVQGETSRIKAAGAGAGTDAAQVATLTNLIEPLTKRKDDLAKQMDSAVTALCVWNGLWQWAIRWVERTSCRELDSEAQIGELRSANSATQVLGLYLLPLLYGWLGALLWVVQRLREDDSAESVEKLKPSSRVVTGLVAGPMIGMFLSPEVLNSLAFQATPFVIAFIGGYSTDVFFAVVERLLAGFRGALENKPAQGGQQQGGQPREGQVQGGAT